MALTIHPYEPGFMDGVLAVFARSLPRDPISLERFTRQVLLDPNFRVEGAVVAHLNKEAAGFCLAIARHVPLENAPSDAERGYITLIAVAPHAQRQGIGSQLLQQAEAYLHSQNRNLVLVAPYAPGYFIPGVDVQVYAGALSFFQKHGYNEVYRPLAMEAPLWDLRQPDWVAHKMQDQLKNVTFTPYQVHLTLPLLEFIQREFPGDWVRIMRETMTRILNGDSPRRLIIAHDEGRVLGFSHYDNERFGPIGVAASERGRGLGQVLMFKTLQAMREQGFRSAWFLWSDDTTARRLYEGAGFKEVRRFALLRKELIA